MTRDEFERLLHMFMSGSANVQALFDMGKDADSNLEKRDSLMKELLTEFDRMQARIEELEAYADKLAAGLPEGMLPKDVENLRNANAAMSVEIENLRWHYPKLGEFPEIGEKTRCYSCSKSC